MEGGLPTGTGVRGTERACKGDWPVDLQEIGGRASWRPFRSLHDFEIKAGPAERLSSGLSKMSHLGKGSLGKNH